MSSEPQSEKISCLGCSAETIARRGEPVNVTKSKTGFYAVMSIRTTFEWLCPSCVDRMIPLLRSMTEIVGTHDLYWGNLAAMLSRMESFRCSAKKDPA